MIVLTPPGRHADRPGELVSFQSWRSRGWCRLEFMAAALSRNELRVMTLKGPEAQPEFEFASLDMIKLAPGRGNFTCCARNHQLPESDVFTMCSSAGVASGGGTVVCDKIKIAVVLDTMVRGED